MFAVCQKLTHFVLSGESQVLWHHAEGKC